uniref:Uncharacterized protein n=1 Tax=Aegilops tauschii subsp. strangulata TaxID=200361 RepID=A0A453QQ43_AEGTS
GKRMEKGRDEDNVQEREEERLARIRARNCEEFEQFGRFRFSNINEENGGPASQRQTKRKKSTAEKPIVEVTRVLRSQTTRDVEEMPCDNIQEDEDHELGQETKGKKGKKRTRMHNVYDRLGTVPPIRVQYNEDGQPVGDNASEFSNFISTLVKCKISLRHTDWRKVEVEQKIQLWTTLKVMGSAAKKWRDFKS